MTETTTTEAPIATDAMALTTDTTALAAALAVVVRAISKTTAVPVLTNLLLEAQKGELRLTATNLELGIRKAVTAEVETPGATTVPARLLADYVASLPPNARLEMSLADGLLSLRSDRYVTHIRSMAAREFPTEARAQVGTESITLPLPALLAAVERVEFAASSDEARPVMTGVLLEVDASNVTLVATDGHRLATQRIPQELSESPQRLEPGTRLIVPARAVAELPRAFKGEGDVVEMLVTQLRRSVTFRCGRAEVTSRLIEGTYPNYQQVLPTTANTTVNVSTADLAQALRAVATFARDGANMVRLHVWGDDNAGNLTVTTRTIEIGDGRVDLDARVAGAEVEVAFNVRYLLEALGPMGDRVEIRLSGPMAPAVLVDPAVDGVHVIMPVRAAG